MPKTFTAKECEHLAKIVNGKPDSTLQGIKEMLSKGCSLMVCIGSCNHLVAQINFFKASKLTAAMKKSFLCFQK